MDAKPTPIQQRFYLGFYSEIETLYLSGELDASLNERPEDIAYVMGALSFLGRLTSTENLLTELERTTSTPSILCHCRFYYLLLLTRLSHYQKARAEIFKLLHFRHHSQTHSAFFGHQALAFYRFYQGRYTSAKENALRSLSSARGAYESLLAKDLLGHIYFHLGMRALGENYFQSALALASSIGLKGFERLTKNALIGHQIENGEALGAGLEHIANELAQTSSESFYSRSELYLRLAKIHRLRGERELALTAINEASITIYKHQNRRHMSLLYLNMASLELLAGAGGRALQLIDVGLAQLDKHMDYDHQLKLKGLKYKVLKSLHFDDEAQMTQLRAEIFHLTDLVGSSMAKQIREREYPHQNESKNDIARDDRLGELLGKLKNTPSIKELSLADWEILARDHLFGLIDLTKEASTDQGETLIIIGKLSKSLIVGKAGNYHYSTKGVTTLTLGFLRLLNERGKLTKEEITKELYGHDYNPLSHDSLIHTLVGRVRRAVSESAHLIENEEGHYRWARGHVLVDCALTETTLGQKVKSISKLDSELNIRQFKLLEKARTGELRSIGPGEYRRIFKVSRITATRDLRELCDLGFFSTLGKARSITYIYGNHSEVTL